MNARLRTRYPGENQIMGEFVFAQPGQPYNSKSNRALLTSFCHANDLFIANTGHSHADDELVTYYELAAQPMQPIAPNKFAQIDFIMCPLEWRNKIADVRSLREIPIGSHHFMLLCNFGQPIKLEKQKLIKNAQPRLDYDALLDTTIANNFVSAFEITMNNMSDARNMNELLMDLNSAIRTAANTQIPVVPPSKNKPWISNEALDLIQQRSAQRILGNYELEKMIHKRLRSQIKIDRQKWLDDILDNGSWAQIKKYKRRI